MAPPAASYVPTVRSPNGEHSKEKYSSKCQDGSPRKQGKRNVCPEAGRRRQVNHSGLRREDLLDETVASRPPGREHSTRMLGGGEPPSLMIDQVMRPRRFGRPE